MRVVASTARPSVQARMSVTKKASNALISATLASVMLVSPAMASVDFANVKNGAKVSSPVHLDFVVTGKEVKAVAEGDQSDKSGHFHVIIDGEAVVPTGVAIPFDAAHNHFGKGQSSADLELAPGKHSLTLQFANIKHESYGKEFSKNISITVQ